MTNKTIRLSDALYDYLLSVSSREPEVLRHLRAETASYPEATMQIAPEQGQFMTFLVRLLGVKKAIEIGVFTGYSSLCVALGLPPDGQLIACDVNPQWTSVAERYWRQAGIAGKIDLRLAPAVETLQQLLAGGAAGTFDYAFIDADKESYIDYYELSLLLLRPGGLILVDNVLWGGRVADPGAQDQATEAIRRFNLHLKEDARVDLSMIPVADGLTLARKR
ncbi:MAG: putative O-methyltransferase [Chromatiales bacterium USCg_Taylor]|nr:MAG: putative O-methyltransferase [Chromatiales bacterium USCg_Taylor]